MPLTAAHLRKLADELEAEEAAAQKELDDAETASEREAARKELADLRAEIAETKRDLAAARTSETTTEDEGDEDEGDEGDEGEQKRPKMRKGRKRGMVYRNEETGMGEVWQGDDEDDLVPVDEGAA